MLDICIDSARVVTENLKQAFASPWGIFLGAALSGMIGIVILLAFSFTLFSESALSVLLPFIIAFNAASSGFYLVDKGGHHFPRLRISLIVIAALLTGAGCFTMTVLLPWESVTAGPGILISGLSALIFSFFGAWIGSKSKNMDHASQ